MALIAACCSVACDGPSTADGGAEVADASAADSGAKDAQVLDAGSPDSGPTDAGNDAGELDAGERDAGALDAGSPGALVEVSHTREMRAVWVATVSRLDFPSSTSLSTSQARAELGRIVDVSASVGMNTIFFHVRPESDALYASASEPWSRFLTGTQGTDPGYDPLAILLELAHERGVEVHAWINPYRAKTSTSVTTAPTHVTQRFPEAAVTYNGQVVMDPSDTRVRAHIVDVVRDLTRRYDIDGLVVDDYFYPYPSAGEFPDDDAYQAYVEAGGTLGKGDWRRANVNAFMADAAVAIKAEKAWVRWGAAPFGIYRPGMPPGVVGLDAYEAISCDALRWLDEGWVDYIAPQLYWPTDSSGQPFGDLVSWWADQATAERPVIPSLAVYKMADQGWTRAEMEMQVALTRAEAPASAGNTWFRYGYIENDARGERAMVAALYSQPALPPVVPGMRGVAVEPPIATPVSGGLSLGHASSGSIRGYAVYRRADDAWTFTEWVPAASHFASLPPGRYAVTAVNRGDVESLGVDVTLR